MTSHEFRNIRLALGISKAEIGRILGRHRTSILRYEDGRTKIGGSVLLLMEIIRWELDGRPYNRTPSILNVVKGRAA